MHTLVFLEVHMGDEHLGTQELTESLEDGRLSALQHPI